MVKFFEVISAPFLLLGSLPTIFSEWRESTVSRQGVIPACKTHWRDSIDGGIYIGRPLLTHSTFHARAKIFSSQKIESRFGSQKFPSLGLGQKFLPCRFGRKFSVWRLGESFLKRSEWYDPYISNDDGTLKSLIFSITKQQLPINNHQIPPAYRQAGTPPFSKGGDHILSAHCAMPFALCAFGVPQRFPTDGSPTPLYYPFVRNL